VNEIEQKFYDAFLSYASPIEKIQAQVPFEIYTADFVIYPDAFIPSIVEIDGHDFHKTKMQRLRDYQRERYFMSLGYSIIRFMASEVYVDAGRCAIDAMRLSCDFSERMLSVYNDGYKRGLKEKEENINGSFD